MQREPKLTLTLAEALRFDASALSPLDAVEVDGVVIGVPLLGWPPRALVSYVRGEQRGRGLPESPEAPTD